MRIKKKTLRIINTIIVIVILFTIVYFVGFRNTSKQNYDEFAKCLTEKGAVMYGTYWCKYCNAQKREFGDSFKFVDYVECSENPDDCTEKGIQGFPTWIINENKYPGKQPLARLAALTNCNLEG